jgi:dimethylglycine dehydrogenase
MGVSFSGELAYEIHIPNASLYAAYLAIQKAGLQFNIKLFGARAVDSMRLEKGFLHWKADILTEFDPFETGLDKFVNMNKNEFIGKEALKNRQSKECLNKLVSLEISTKIAPAHGGATLSIKNKVIGTVTSGDWGHRINKNIAYAFIKSEYSSIGSEVFVDILGEKINAKIIESCPYDPNFNIIKG